MPSIARDAAHRVASVRLVNHRMGSVAAAASRAKIDPVEVCSRMTRSASLQQNLIRIIFRNIRQKWVTKGAPPYVNARQHLQRQDTAWPRSKSNYLDQQLLGAGSIRFKWTPVAGALWARRGAATPPDALPRNAPFQSRQPVAVSLYACKPYVQYLYLRGQAVVSRHHPASTPAPPPFHDVRTLRRTRHIGPRTVAPRW